jgi:hypothetical protein
VLQPVLNISKELIKDAGGFGDEWGGLEYSKKLWENIRNQTESQILVFGNVDDD